MPPTLQITIDCRTPSAVLPFWAAALRYVPAPPPPGHATWRDHYLAIGEPPESLEDGDCCDRLVDPAGIGPAVWFQVVPEPKTVKNRVHLDLRVTDRRAPRAERREVLAREVERLVALGGSVRTPLPDDEGAHLAVGLADPEGNELCLV